MSTARQFSLMRKYGFPYDEPELKAGAAARAGLMAHADDALVIYTLQHGRIGDLAEPGQPVAWEVPIEDIKTDPDRFQNRTDAFSELSAEAVANSYDPNKFDPIVLWNDSKNDSTYVLSGHSRLEGKHRRGERTVASRYFVGSEAEAIQFARVDANRGGTAESITEDLKAYILMRDGDTSRDIKPASKAEMKRAFKDKHSKLESWSYLNPAGMFMLALSDDNRSQYPYIENRAQWVGILRKTQPEMTATHEEDCFNFFYGAMSSGKFIVRDEFEKLVLKRLAFGKERIFPECKDGSCGPLKDLSEQGQHKHIYKELATMGAEAEALRDRLRTSNRVTKVYTDPERAALLDALSKLEAERKRKKRDLGIAEEAPALFGTRRK